jgi:hypothetical protein
MNRKCCGVWTVIFLVIGAALFCLPAEAEEEGAVMIVGTVVESETDEDGNVLAIDLETYEGTYSIELSGEGKELLSYVGETVEIEGVVTEDDEGWRYLEVLSFSVVPDLI